jgi:hypothetical protein
VQSVKLPMRRENGTEGASGPKISRDQEGTAPGAEASSVLGETRKRLEEIQRVIRRIGRGSSEVWEKVGTRAVSC